MEGQVLVTREEEEWGRGDKVHVRDYVSMCLLEQNWLDVCSSL